MKYKGCIMEITEDNMIIMTADCNFRRIKKKNDFQEGMEIEFDGTDIILEKKKNLSQFYLVAAAILLMVITSAYGFQYWDLSNQSVAIVTVDINPSLQLEVNYKNQVVDVTALNQDAEKLPLEALKRKPLQAALEILLQQFKEKGYILHEEENYILFTTVVLQQDKNDGLEIQRILKEAKEEIEEKASIEGEKIEVIAIDASEAMLIKAKEQNVSVGKFKIYEEIKEAAKEKFDDSAIQDVKMKDLMIIRKETKVEKEHPVFDNHPSEKKDEQVKTEVEKEYPVFDSHPSEGKGDKTEIEDKKEHPVFEEHPSNKNNNNDSGGKQKKDSTSSNDDKDNKDKGKTGKKN